MKRLAIVLLLAAAACQKSAEQKLDVERGRQLIGQYGCNVCHSIPGVSGPQGSIGPTLEGLASRPTISNGTVQNTPENLAKFVQSPASLNPSTNMPGLDMPPQDAQEIANYLRTLK
jgi:cytochrome c2